ncbi:bacillithiol biosynthesis deacetylase BshB1 [Solitalea koreensis]|uniref:Bacillithiol biosynthesis deacetylase BshB1 n=1 Tax=Solitalea koreensis TaxID=543615 RepID=A0A521DX64_9SPHI|nr:bacillithiol biosynthesis deacetylase BshB1 [Solitalea koreensis]SMO76235.1 bacillithiol biosynthesis deacetylase BshB1 [Solitalea koreensis]
MKLDILVFASHPDDAELSCSGTIAQHVKLGKKVGVVDLTRGELGTRGTPETRDAEAKVSSKILGLSARENLGFADGFFENDKVHRLEIVKMIRKYQPEIVLANALEDRHPDHGRGGKLVSDAIFLSGLRKVETRLENQTQEPWRPKTVFHYMQDRLFIPDLVVGFGQAEMDIKIASIKAFKTQFYDPNDQSGEPQTYISTPEFFESITGRARELGKSIGAEYGEAYASEKIIGVSDLSILT